jgi:hypothetical protein
MTHPLIQMHHFMYHQFKFLMKNMVIVRLLAILQVLPEHTLQLLEVDDPIA